MTRIIFCGMILSMNYVTQHQLLAQLRSHWERRTSQAALAREIGVKPQNLSQMLRGAPINGRVLKWLGYEAVNGLYRPVAGKRKVQP